MSEEPKKVELSTTDLAAEKLTAFEDLFPGVVADGVLDVGRLTELLNIQPSVVPEGRERYGLMWAGKNDAVRSLLTPSRATLLPDLESSVDFDTARNVFIEGDNLEVLKLLQKAYNDKIKLIYIDPPYNTGNDFVYNDDFTDGLRGYLEFTGQLDQDGRRTSAGGETAGRRHSGWLSMIFPRLVLARNLLKRDGLIFVSIDAIELHNLRSVMDEVFGPENFLGLVTRSTGTPTGGGFDGFVNFVDYMLVYGRSEWATIAGMAFTDADASIYNERDERGQFLTRSLRRTGGEDRREDRPSMYYGLEAPDGSVVFPVGPGGYDSRWICGKKRYDEMLSDGLIAWKVSDRSGTPSWHPYQKFYLEGREKRPSNLWTDLEGNKKATREVRALFGGQKVFETAKPTDLVARVVAIGSSEDDLVLDFFAGSGTTAHAVALQNLADGSQRRCISVNLPEPTPIGSPAREAGYETVSAITLERIRQVMNTVDGADTLGLRTYQLAKSGFRTARTEASNLLDLDLSETTLVSEEPYVDDLAAEIFLSEGVALDAAWERYLAAGCDVVVADGVGVVTSLDVTDEVVAEALKLNLRVVVFLEDGFAGSDAAKANAFTSSRDLGITMKTA